MTSAENGPERLEIVELGRGRTAVRLELWSFGRDLVLFIGGGETHVGAAAVSGTGPAGVATATAVVPGHREEPLARESAQAVSAAAGRSCAVVAGIHQDAATRAEIEAIVVNVREGVGLIADRL